MRQWLSSSPSTTNSDSYYTIGLTGSTGLVGNAFRDELARSAVTVNDKPVRVVRLIRGSSVQEIQQDDKDQEDFTAQWNPHGTTADEILHPTAAQELDAIVHLSGENVATGLGPLGFLGLRPWTTAKKQEILDSRTITTAALRKVIAASTDKAKDFLVASGVGVYGADHFENSHNNDDVLPDESTDVSQTKGFLAEVSRQWEAASQLDEKSHHRIVNMRFGVVLSKNGGALEKLYPIFFLGGGGIVGSGQQYFPFISARDHARAMVHTLQTPSLTGPVNLCAPTPATNAQFTAAFGQCLHRPTLLPFPSFAVQTLFGEMGEEMLLGGVLARPTKLLESGFSFQHGTVKEALKSALEETI